MARLVRLTMTSPFRIDASLLAEGKTISICTCGLSKKFPYCDGTHKIARQELPGKLYTYSDDGSTVLSVTDDPAAPPIDAQNPFSEGGQAR